MSEPHADPEPSPRASSDRIDAVIADVFIGADIDPLPSRERSDGDQFP